MKIHELKTHPQPYAQIADGTKTSEVRRDDRQFNVGDLLVLKEYLPDERTYTGRYQYLVVTHISKDSEGVRPGFAVLSFTWFSRPRARVATWEVE